MILSDWVDWFYAYWLGITWCWWFYIGAAETIDLNDCPLFYSISVDNCDWTGSIFCCYWFEFTELLVEFYDVLWIFIHAFWLDWLNIYTFSSSPHIDTHYLPANIFLFPHNEHTVVGLRPITKYVKSICFIVFVACKLKKNVSSISPSTKIPLLFSKLIDDSP